MSRPFNID